MSVSLVCHIGAELHQLFGGISLVSSVSFSGGGGGGGREPWGSLLRPDHPLKFLSIYNAK